MNKKKPSSPLKGGKTIQLQVNFENNALMVKDIKEFDGRGLFAVGMDGAVYVYQGLDWGWSKLNMTVMTREELMKKYRAKARSNSNFDPFAEVDADVELDLYGEDDEARRW